LPLRGVATSKFNYPLKIKIKLKKMFKQLFEEKNRTMMLTLYPDALAEQI
jgi:hypothetical protein